MGIYKRTYWKLGRRRRHWSYGVIARTGRGEREYTTMAAGLAVVVIRKLKKFGEAEGGTSPRHG